MRFIIITILVKVRLLRTSPDFEFSPFFPAPGKYTELRITGQKFPLTGRKLPPPWTVFRVYQMYQMAMATNKVRLIYFRLN